MITYNRLTHANGPKHPPFPESLEFYIFGLDWFFAFLQIPKLFGAMCLHTNSYIN